MGEDFLLISVPLSSHGSNVQPHLLDPRRTRAPISCFPACLPLFRRRCSPTCFHKLLQPSHRNSSLIHLNALSITCMVRFFISVIMIHFQEIPNLNPFFLCLSNVPIIVIPQIRDLSYKET